MKQRVIAFFHWQWVKAFLYWLVVSAGTVSECVFLIASIWVSLNATVHPLMLQMMSQQATVTISQLAISAFTSLPEIILGLAVVTTYGHIKYWCMHRKRSSIVWAILFGVPTIVFASLTVWTLIASALAVGYAMPSVLVATRVLAGYAYGFLSMLYVLIEKPDMADHIASLNGTIDDLNKEIEKGKVDFDAKLNQIRLQATLALAESKKQIDDLETIIESQDSQVKRLAERACRAASQGLENYPKVEANLVSQGIKTVLYDAIPELTGHSKQRLAKAKLQRHPRNKDLVVVASLVNWLRTAPLPECQIVDAIPQIERSFVDTDPVETVN
jgi:hypothetical protein